ncbi:MAG: nucleoside-diphosphate sugar epimerase/dehydratase [Oribacterium sp.]|nr:nucleoside-diphosphate sugar epimerase/dehydratase [Oribacterium sp.]
MSDSKDMKENKQVQEELHNESQSTLQEKTGDTIVHSARHRGPFLGGLQHWQVIAVILACYDIFAVNFSYFFALLLRFDFRNSAIPANYYSIWLNFAPFYTVICILVFLKLNLYRSVWRFASYSELLRSILASGITALVQIVGTLAFFGRMPISYYIVGTVFQFGMILGIRFSYRFILLLRESTHRGVASGTAGGNATSTGGDSAALAAGAPTINVMLIGAGNAGQMILRDIHQSREVNENVCCIIDDNPNKWGRFIDGVKIEGGRDDIFACAEKYHIKRIYLAIPSATAAQKRDILNICKETRCELKQLPGMYQLVTGQVRVSQMRDVSVEDLLGREPIRTDLTEVFQFITGKTVLVTGGGGSIGSELCRQIASHQPKQLIIFDVYENNAYSIQLELRQKYPDLNLEVLIGSVRDSRKMFDLFEKYHPEIVYHAAAHKHVPLMEDSPCEAIKNNVIGTYKTAYAAMVHGCDRFVLISTDKAVNPTNIMGASKRLCEMVIQTFDQKIKAGRAAEIPQLFTHDSIKRGDVTPAMLANAHTQFVAVRFGNVLGSNGSVIPIFKRQIAQGGPVTVTSPDIIRYFMTIPEAVSLVLLAGTYAKGGEIFVLDMGSPVKIDTLARNLIKLSGFKPDVDIKIEYTGLRPGEKLYEEKLMAEEGLRKTDNDLIFIGQPIAFDQDAFLSGVRGLMEAAYKNKDDIREYVKRMVSTYHPAA